MSKDWYKALIGKSLYEAYRSDEEQKPIAEYGKVLNIQKHAINGWFFVQCEKETITLTKLQVSCLIEKGVYHGCKKFTHVKKED